MTADPKELHAGMIIDKLREAASMLRDLYDDIMAKGDAGQITGEYCGFLLSIACRANDDAELLMLITTQFNKMQQKKKGVDHA